MSKQKKQSAEAAVRDIRRRTRRKFSPEEKIRIVLEGLRGEQSVTELCRREGTSVIYGTIRLIERDDETFLAWAREDYACVIFNICTAHTPAGVERSARDFRRLIDSALARGGSYYLTYHRHATREQVLAAYPQFPEFLAAKLRHDPEQRFQSDWYRHHAELLAGAPTAAAV